MTPSPEPGAEENGDLPLIGYCVDLRLCVPSLPALRWGDLVACADGCKP